jgi:hypothetical protein
VSGDFRLWCALALLALTKGNGCCVVLCICAISAFLFLIKFVHCMFLKNKNIVLCSSLETYEQNSYVYSFCFSDEGHWMLTKAYNLSWLRKCERGELFSMIMEDDNTTIHTIRICLFNLYFCF